MILHLIYLDKMEEQHSMSTYLNFADNDWFNSERVIGKGIMTAKLLWQNTIAKKKIDKEQAANYQQACQLGGDVYLSERTIFYSTITLE